MFVLKPKKNNERQTHFMTNYDQENDCCRKYPKKYFTTEVLDYFCSKVCQIESDKSMSL